MASFDGVRDHTRGAVFSMEFRIGAHAFRLWFELEGCQVYTLVPVKNPALKGRQHRWWSQATRSRRPQTSTRRPPSDTKRNIATPLPNTSRAFANGNTIAAGETQAQAGPSVARQRIKHWNHLRVSIKHAHGNTKASETKAHQPRVPRGREGVTLGILSPLGSGYEFQGWLGLEERREWGTNLLAGSIPQGCAEHIAAACAHLENVTRTATKAASVPRSRTADPR